MFITPQVERGQNEVRKMKRNEQGITLYTGNHYGGQFGSGYSRPNVSSVFPG